MPDGEGLAQRLHAARVRAPHLPAAAALDDDRRGADLDLAAVDAPCSASASDVAPWSVEVAAARTRSPST